MIEFEPTDWLSKCERFSLGRDKAGDLSLWQKQPNDGWRMVEGEFPDLKSAAAKAAEIAGKGQVVS